MTKRSRRIVIGGAVALILVGCCLLAVPGCAHGRQLSAAAAADTQLQTVFSPKGSPLTYRKEILLPASCGKELRENEDFVEVWSGKEKLGWIYLVTERGHIQRTGYQLVDKEFVPLVGQELDENAIDTSEAKATLIDGKESK
ncbi:MAG TPA: hypothetical protein PK280_01310 [Planctomycetota bacterium]|nr:hypothetical protein [Planctomycetota bacterium]